jgi:hypothetical protein
MQSNANIARWAKNMYNTLWKSNLVLAGAKPWHDGMVQEISEMDPFRYGRQPGRMPLLKHEALLNKFEAQIDSVYPEVEQKALDPRNKMYKRDKAGLDAAKQFIASWRQKKLQYMTRPAPRSAMRSGPPPGPKKSVGFSNYHRVRPFYANNKALFVKPQNIMRPIRQPGNTSLPMWPKHIININAKIASKARRGTHNPDVMKKYHEQLINIMGISPDDIRHAPASEREMGAQLRGWAKGGIVRGNNVRAALQHNIRMKKQANLMALVTPRLRMPARRPAGRVGARGRVSRLLRMLRI